MNDDYLIQFAGDSCASSVWSGPTPQPGVNCPSDARFCLFQPVNGDRTIQNYQISDTGEQVYNPPVEQS